VSTRTLRLRDDWDVPIQPPARGRRSHGRFVGRRAELDRLVDEVLRSPHKSILISGYRGVGKTSLVYRTLDEIEGRRLEPNASSRKEYVYVLLNAAQLEAERSAESGIEPRRILENLIRRLYTAWKAAGLNAGLTEEVGNLYRKAVASEFKESELVEQKLSEIATRESEKDVSVRLKDAKVGLLASLAGGAAGVGLAVAWAPSNSALSIIPVLVGALPGVLSAGYRLTVRTESRQEVSNVASGLYAFDASLGNLEFDLDDIHHRLQAAGIKVVYVIDELDKLDEGRVAEVLKFFKNLFTLSSAIFIFVGGEELYRRFHRPPSGDPEIYRGREYTYFTSKYFLSRPGWADVNEFFDSLFIGVQELGDEEREQLEQLKRVVALEASGDFFDLVQRIKDYVTLEGGEPALQLPEFGPRQRLQSSLQKALTIVFEDTYQVQNPSRWQENELILRALYRLADGISTARAGQPFQDPEGEGSTDSASRDFLGFLDRLGVLNATGESESEIGGLKLVVRTYQRTGNAPLAVPDSLGMRSEVEERFFQRCEQVWGRVRALGNTQRLVNDEDPLSEDASPDAALAGEVGGLRGFETVSSAFAPRIPVYVELLTAEPPYDYRREEFEEWAAGLAGVLELLRLNVHEFLARLIASAVPGSQEQALTLPLPNVLMASPSMSRRALVVTIRSRADQQALLEWWRSDRDELAVAVIVDDPEGQVRLSRWPKGFTPHVRLTTDMPKGGQWSRSAAENVRALSDWLI